MARHCRLVAPVVLALAFFAPAVFAQQQPQPALPLSKQVDAAIDKAVEALLAKQLPDGSWGPHSDYKQGPTALALYALLEAGVNHNDPKIVKGLEWLAKNRTDMNYELGVRCNVWLIANRLTGGKYLEQLKTDGKRLEEAGAKTGKYGYNLTANWVGGDNSNNQYGLLGVWAAARGGYEVSQEYWNVVMKHWLDCQNTDGGWSYLKGMPSYGTMTAAGVASLFVCYDRIYSSAFVTCNASGDFGPIQRGLDYFDRNFANMVALKGNAPMVGAGGAGDEYYFFYGIERVGLASGYKYFGTADWYKLGAQELLRRQAPTGGWTGGRDFTVSTPFSLLFLIRGRNPVLFNKLQYETANLGANQVSIDWNCRPRDLANLTTWISDKLERTVNWQIINLRVPVKDWHDAPILYIHGSKEPKFSPEEIEKLRQYVLQGGTIMSCTGCKGQAFTKGIKDLYSKMFPQYEMITLPLDHDIYSKKTQYDIKQDFRTRVNLQIITNGIRPLVIHTDEDLPRYWQTNEWKSAATGGESAFQMAANIFMYVTDKASLRSRAAHTWPDEYKGAAKQTSKIVRLKWNGNCNPEPLALERFSRLFSQQTQIKLDTQADALPIGDLAASGAKIAVLSGAGQIKLTAEETTALKAFVDGGGTLVVDAAGGDESFASTSQAIVENTWKMQLRRLAAGAELYNNSSLPDGKIDTIKWRKRTAVRMGADKAPNLRGLTFPQAGSASERIGVVFSREDITNAGLVGYEALLVEGYDPGEDLDGSAYRVMRNIALYALGQSGGATATAPAAGPAGATGTTTAPAAKPAPAAVGK